VAGLIAAGYALYKNWDTVSAGLVAGWEQVKTTAWNFLTTLPEKAGYAVGYVVGWFRTLPDRITGIFRSLDSVGQTFISMAIEWGRDAVNGLIDGFLSLPGKLTGVISRAWDAAKAGFDKGVAAGSGGVKQNASGGIYGRGAFLTTFAERSPEAAIPIDGSQRAAGLWTRTGEMLGLLKHGTAAALPELNLPNASAPVINNVFNISGISDPGKVREEVEKAADLSLQKFRTLFNQMQMDQRRVSYS
jgi:hypothetical protein